MGRRGPPPKPQALKKAQGTYRKDRDPTLQAQALPAGAPPMPRDLPPAAKKRWMEIVPELLQLETLATIDGGSLEAYCRTFAQWRKLQKLAAEEPLVMTFRGQAANPLAAEARKLHKEVIQPLELALGLNYAARNKVKMPPKAKPEDPVEEDLFGKGAGPGLKALPGGKESA